PVQLAHLEGAADWLVVHDDVTAIPILGFCMGGMYALKAAATCRFDRAVAFYGMIRVPEAWRGPEQREPLELVADGCPTLAIFGRDDHWTPPEAIAAMTPPTPGPVRCASSVYRTPPLTRRAARWSRDSPGARARRGRGCDTG